ncbi:MAG: cation diffusion facilitator family transporter [Sulfolobales archaeon]
MVEMSLDESKNISVLRDPRLRLVIVSLLITLTILTARVIVYILTHSMAVLADAIHSASDITANIIALVSLLVSLKGPDRDHPYGHGKAESLGSFSISLLLLFLSTYILSESISRILHGYGEIEFTVYSTAILGATLVLDLWRSRALERGGVKYGSLVLRADALHYKSDLYITSSVLTLGLISVVYDNESLIRILDSILSLAIVSYIVLASYRMMRISIDELMDRSVVEVEEEFKRIARELGAEVRLVRTRRVGERIFVDAVIRIPREARLREAHEVTEEIERTLRKRSSRDIDIIIHVEP